MWRYRYPEELYHYGVKGMKWGIRRGTPYPVKKKSVTNSSKDDTIKNAIRSGRVTIRVNRQKQLRHIKGSSGYVKGKSYIDGNLNTAQQLINELSGTGEPIMDRKGRWTHKERVKTNKEIGTHVDRTTKEETRTNAALITYSRTGTHIIPRRKEDEP